MRIFQEKRVLSLVFVISAFLSTGFGECSTHFKVSGTVLRAGQPVVNRPVVFTFHYGTSKAEAFSSQLNQFGNAVITGTAQLSNDDPGLTATVDGRTAPCKAKYVGEGAPYTQPGTQVHETSYFASVECDLANAKPPRTANLISPLPRDTAPAGQLALDDPDGRASERLPKESEDPVAPGQPAARDLAHAAI